MDNYTNLTVKSLFMLKWFTQNCKNKIGYLMKADEDVYVNLINLNHILVNEPKLRNGFGVMGYVNCNSGIPDKVRLKTGHKVYPKDCMFPNIKSHSFTGGPAYLMDVNTAVTLFQASFHTTPVAFEDLYITGILAKK